VIQGSQCGAIRPASQTPTEPASAWLSTVATKMPAMMAHGLRSRAARTKDSNWVLSPISASATRVVEVRKASTDRARVPQVPFLAGKVGLMQSA
jgi:hypothetical protein